MSLSSLLERDKELTEYLRQLAVKPKLPVPAPALLAPPHSRNYGLVGTAFDYLLRWRLQHANPRAQARRWVAEAAIQRLPPSRQTEGTRVLKQAKDCHARFLAQGELTEDLMVAAIGLAQLDTVFRSRRGITDVGSEPEPHDIEDLSALWAAVPSTLLCIQHRCLLNPTFGVASRAVGGADADFIADDMLVDVKTTKNFELERIAFDQLIGYVLLARIGGIDGASRTAESIARVAIYFARYGLLVPWPVATLVSQQGLVDATHWLQAHLPSLSAAGGTEARPNKAVQRSAARVARSGR